MLIFQTIKARYFYWAALLVFVISLVTPAFVVQFDPGWPSDGLIWYGYSVLIGGWAGILIGQFAWYANVLFLATLLALREKRYRIGMILSIAGCMLGLQTFLFTTFPRNEGGVGDYVINHYGIGFYLWESSLILLLAYSWVMFRNWRMKM